MSPIRMPPCPSSRGRVIFSSSSRAVMADIALGCRLGTNAKAGPRSSKSCKTVSKKDNPPVISPVMHGLATYIANAQMKELPDDVVEKTKHHVLDTIAAMVSGSRLLPGQRAISYIGTRGGTEESCVVASQFTTSVENAALANGMLAHADETDDSHTPTSQHPGCGIISAALAMAERESPGGEGFARVQRGRRRVCRRSQFFRRLRRIGSHRAQARARTIGTRAGLDV